MRSGLQTLQPAPSPMIQSSWRRCIEHGLSSRLHTEQSLLSSVEMRRQHDQNQQLRRLAVREMQLLEGVLRGDGPHPAAGQQ